MIHTRDTYAAFLAERDQGEAVEIDEALFEYFLELLPPRYMFRAIAIRGIKRHVTFGFAEGDERVTAFWREGDRFFAQLTDG